MKNSFLLQTIFCVFVGIIFGQVVHYIPYGHLVAEICFGLVFIFSEYLNFLVPLIVLVLVVSSIFSMGQNAFGLLSHTIILSILSMLSACLLAYSFVYLLHPYFTQPLANMNDATGFAVSPSVVPYSIFNFKLTPVIDIFSALILAISIGLAGTNQLYLVSLFSELKAVIFSILNDFIITLIPYYIGLSLFKISYSNYLFQNFFHLLSILIFIIMIQLLFIIILYTVVGFYLRCSPINLIIGFAPSYLSAAGIMSSTMAIPITLEVFKNNKISNKVSEFVVPICATIHLPGAAINQVSAALLIYYFFNGVLPDFATFSLFLVSLIMILIAAPSIPGGAIISTIPLFKLFLLFPETAISLVYIISITNDYFSTGTNTMSDGAIGLVLNKIVVSK